MYSFSYLEPVCWSMSSSNCCFLTCKHVYGIQRDGTDDPMCRAVVKISVFLQEENGPENDPGKEWPIKCQEDLDRVMLEKSKREA